MVITILVIRTLILLFQSSDAIIDLALFIVKLMLGRINDDHAVLDSTSKLRFCRTKKCHVSNEVRDHTHLKLRVIDFFSVCTLILHISHTRLLCIFHLRVKAFQFPKWGFRSDAHPGGCRVAGDDHNSIAIKVRSRQTLCNMSIDTDCICRGYANHFLCICLTIVNFQNGDLKRSAMWVSNQSNSLTVFIVRCIDLIVFHRSYRQNNMILLTWQSRCI